MVNIEEFIYGLNYRDDGRFLPAHPLGEDDISFSRKYGRDGDKSFTDEHGRPYMEDDPEGIYSDGERKGKIKYFTYEGRPEDATLKTRIIPVYLAPPPVKFTIKSSVKYQIRKNTDGTYQLYNTRQKKLLSKKFATREGAINQSKAYQKFGRMWKGRRAMKNKSNKR